MIVSFCVSGDCDAREILKSWRVRIVKRIGRDRRGWMPIFDGVFVDAVTRVRCWISTNQCL